MSDAGAMLDARWARAWALAAARAIRSAREELTELDRQIGDGDHGENLDRGFTALAGRLGHQRTETVAEVWRLAATTLISTVGGASGPLYGTAFLRAATAISDPNRAAELTTSDLVVALRAALDGIEQLGKAKPGEKTMVDAWQAALDAATGVVTAGASALEVVTAVAQGAEAGAAATVPMLATKGRAAYLGERSIGHLDPGAHSTALILRAAHTALERPEGVL